MNADASRLRTLQIGFMVSGRPEPASGSERYYLDLLRTLPQCGVDSAGLVVGDPTRSRPSVPTVESFAPEVGGALARLRNLRGAVARQVPKSDVIVSHHAQHALPVLDLLGRKPFVVHFHGPLVREGRAEGVGRKNLFMRGLAERLTYRRARRIIVLSRAFGDIVEADYGIDPARVRVIPGGVDLARFDRSITRRAAREKLGWPTDRPIAVSVRRLAATKGLENLVDAMEAVRKRVPDALLVLVGGGPLAPDLRARAEARGLADAILFAGRISDELLPLAYRAADVSITPSVALEGFGLVVVESLACGTPGLVTPVTGLPEVVRDLDPALILADGTSDAIANGLAGALDGSVPLPSEAQCIAYVQRFDWRTIAGRIAAVYAEAR